MRVLWRWLRRGLWAVLIVLAGLLSPVAYVETACRPAGTAAPYAALIAPEHHRAEGRTLLTYPEWHIVHAYDDYAEVIRTSDPHDFAFLQSVAGFWGALCPLARASGAHGGFDRETKQMIYTIGVSFTAEFLLKAGYEETLGRLAAWLRGPIRAPLDDLSARQASDYADFLQQVPWYRWDFTADRMALAAAATPALRDRERALALGLEARAKAGYAGVIAAAVAGIAPDALTMRVIVRGLPDAALSSPGVTLIARRAEGDELEVPRYRAFTDLARVWALQGAEFVEIAGNDDILFTAISDAAVVEGALHSFARQGNTGHRHLMMGKVSGLANALRDPTLHVEHVHDY